MQKRRQARQAQAWAGIDCSILLRDNWLVQLAFGDLVRPHNLRDWSKRKNRRNRAPQGAKPRQTRKRRKVEKDENDSSFALPRSLAERMSCMAKHLLVCASSSRQLEQEEGQA